MWFMQWILHRQFKCWLPRMWQRPQQLQGWGENEHRRVLDAWEHTGRRPKWEESNFLVLWPKKFRSMWYSAFLSSLLTIASVQYFSFNTKLQLIVLVDRNVTKNSVYVQKDSGNFHTHLWSQFRTETKLKHSCCAGIPQDSAELLSTHHLKEQTCKTCSAKLFVLVFLTWAHRQCF